MSLTFAHSYLSIIISTRHYSHNYYVVALMYLLGGPHGYNVYKWSYCSFDLHTVIHDFMQCNYEYMHCGFFDLITTTVHVKNWIIFRKKAWDIKYVLFLKWPVSELTLVVHNLC